MVHWQNKRVLVTGGAGFLVSFVVEKLRERECRTVIVPRSKDYDLRDRDAIIRLFREVRPELVIHLAGIVGGIGANQAHPGRFFYDNAIMGIQLMEYGRQFGVQKFVAVGTVCAYPKSTAVPFREDALWNGYPEETNAPCRRRTPARTAGRRAPAPRCSRTRAGGQGCPCGRSGRRSRPPGRNRRRQPRTRCR